MAHKITSAVDKQYRRKLTPKEGAAIYADLRQKVTQAGILKRDYWHYLLITIIDLGALGFLVVVYFLHNNPLLLILNAAAIAFFIVRIGGLLHDAGHRSIFSSALSNDIYGYSLAMLIAFPFYSWKVKHNAHHAHTNQINEDPDLDIPFNFLEEKPIKQAALNRFVYKYQHLLYYPLGSLVAFTVRFNAVNNLLKKRTKKTVALNLPPLITMSVLYFAPFLIFPWWKALIFFVVTNEVTGFYLLNIFAPNHKGMPQISRQSHFSFFEQQIITSRNLYGNWLTDYIYLGLNYQIEHHLFIDCPRRKLKQIQPIVKKLCKQYHIKYLEMSAYNSNKFILAELKKAAAYA